jgi:hypothetical protein
MVPGGPVTGNNPNVLAEVGMMMALGKTLLVLKQREDGAEVRSTFDSSMSGSTSSMCRVSRAS